MKVKYIGESFTDVGSVTDGKVYECAGIEEVTLFEDLGAITMIKIIDDSGSANLYSPANPAPADASKFKGGRWEIVEDDGGKLAKVIPAH